MGADVSDEDAESISNWSPFGVGGSDWVMLADVMWTAYSLENQSLSRDCVVEHCNQKDVSSQNCMPTILSRSYM